MAAADRPAHVKPFFNGPMRQWTEVMCPTAVDNLERVECDWDLPPALHRRVGKGVWYSVEHEVPVHTLTTALESVGDKIMSHHQSQLLVYKEPRMQCLPRGTGKRKLGDNSKPVGAPPPPPHKPSPSFGRGRPGCTPHWRSAVYCVIGSEDIGLFITHVSPSTSTPRPSRRRRIRRTWRRASALPSLWVLRPYLNALVTVPPHWCRRTRGSSPCPRKCASPLLPASCWHLGKTGQRCTRRVRPVATSASKLSSGAPATGVRHHVAQAALGQQKE